MSDVLGRRKLMLLAYAWFSIGMAVTALMSSTTTFELMRFVMGLGVGALVATTGAIVVELRTPEDLSPYFRDQVTSGARPLYAA